MPIKVIDLKGGREASPHTPWAPPHGLLPDSLGAALGLEGQAGAPWTALGLEEDSCF